MFEVIFIRRSTQEKHRGAPLRHERERFLSSMQEQGYSRYSLGTTANLSLHIVRLIGLTNMRPVGEAEIREAAVRWA